MARTTPPSKKRGHARTDYGNAERLVERHGARIRFSRTHGGWLVWTSTGAGGVWRRDETGEVERLAKDTVRKIYQEAIALPTKEAKAEMFAHAFKSESAKALRAMVELAKSEPGITVRHHQLDTDPWALTVENGMVDLRTGELGPNAPERLTTKLVPIAYDPKAECPRWLAVLDRIFAGNERLISFIQRGAGYSLTGVATEQCFFFLYGMGANGKTTVLEVLRMIAGEYSAAADFTTFLERKGGDGGPRNDVARLAGVRLVTSSELGEGRRLSENLIKELTGTDKISARFLFQESFEFQPQFKIWLAGNHKPVIKGTDEGIWRRPRLIPFTVQIPPAERDPELLDKLRAELPGILRWAVEGCLAWQREGLGMPPEVEEAIAGYRAESDIIGAFLRQCCVEDPSGAVPMRELYARYRAWAEEAGEHPLAQRTFAGKLEDRGIRGGLFTADRTAHRFGIRLYSPNGNHDSPEKERERGSERQNPVKAHTYAQEGKDGKNASPSLSSSQGTLPLTGRDLAAGVEHEVDPELLDERAGILEFDGQLTREEAERRITAQRDGGTPSDPARTPPERGEFEL